MNEKNKHAKPNAHGFARVANFLEGKGFYIVLFLCIAAIGISGYVIFFGDPGQSPDVYEPQLAEQSDSGSETSSASGDTLLPYPAADSAADSSLSGVPDTPAAPKSDAEKAPVFFMRPVAGAVSAAFSGSELAYNVTLEDWRMHHGIDIDAAVGEQVKAIADGVVKDVYYDSLSGKTVIIEHDGGYVSAYSNLQDEVFVSKAQEVSAGTIIGGVGDTMLAEANQPPHLHLEVKANGQSIDPETILPKPAN